MSVNSEPNPEVNVENSEWVGDDCPLSSATYLMQMLEEKYIDVKPAFNLLNETKPPAFKDGNVRECGHCGKLYTNAKSLQFHLRMQHSSEPCIDMRRCVPCDKTYASVLSLKRHQRYKHRYPHACTACYKRFPTTAKLAEHAVSCVRADRPCPTCGKIYGSQLSLRNHIKYKHPQNKTNWCGLCSRAFMTDRSLFNHMTAIHPVGIACDSCDKKFSTVKALMSHVLFKHSVHSFQCNKCMKVFASQVNLTRHLTNIQHFARSHTLI